MDLAFSQIRHYGQADAVIRAKLIETTERVAGRVPTERRAALARQASLASELTIQG